MILFAFAIPYVNNASFYKGTNGDCDRRALFRYVNPFIYIATHGCTCTSYFQPCSRAGARILRAIKKNITGAFGGWCERGYQERSPLPSHG